MAGVKMQLSSWVMGGQARGDQMLIKEDQGGAAL